MKCDRDWRDSRSLREEINCRLIFPVINMERTFTYTDRTRKENKRQQACLALSNVWSFLEKHLPLANTHGADFITRKHWDVFVPHKSQQWLLALTREELVNLPKHRTGDATNHIRSLNLQGEENNSDTRNTSSSGIQLHDADDQDDWLCSFIAGAYKCNLDNTAVLSTMLDVVHHDDLENFALRGDVISEAMSEKKNHEIKAMSESVVSLVRCCKTHVVVDVGSGKGYLGSELAHHYRLPVLGLDSCDTNTKGASHRDEKLARKLKGVTRRKEKTSVTKPDSRHSSGEGSGTPDLSLYVPITLSVHPDMNLHTILEDHANHLHLQVPRYSNILLTGLHTCGSLSVTVMKLFLQNPGVSGLCYVGCCYQLMDESLIDDVSLTSHLDHFPLSQSGKQHGIHLGRNARNLASQSVVRIQASGQLQGGDFCWRAMLNVLLHDLGLVVPERIPGMRRLNKKSKSFQEYVQAALGKLRISPNMVSPGLVAAIEDKYQGTKEKMSAFFQLQLILAPVIESLILLDRYLYLLEQDQVDDAHIVRMFDPATSPRCYAIIAIKANVQF